jgi:hypothetical protein
MSPFQESYFQEHVPILRYYHYFSLETLTSVKMADLIESGSSGHTATISARSRGIDFSGL